MFFPGLHLGPRACSPQAKQQMNRGQEAGLRSARHVLEKKERGLGLTCAEETKRLPAVCHGHLAKLKEHQLDP